METIIGCKHKQPSREGQLGAECACESHTEPVQGFGHDEIVLAHWPLPNSHYDNAHDGVTFPLLHIFHMNEPELIPLRLCQFSHPRLPRASCGLPRPSCRGPCTKATGQPGSHFI